jgi:inosine/xanthosine triphosphatase
MKVAVGSTNPIKIQAVMEAFQETFGDVEVRGIKVDSEVSDQPFKDEVIKGSVNRAKNVLKLIDADFGIGIEGGVMKLGERWYNLGFVAIVDREGGMGTGTSGWFECPPTILELLKSGRELGEVMDDLTGRTDTKKQEGAIGIFTKGKVSRKDLYKHGVFMALISFLSPEVFRREG